MIKLKREHLAEIINYSNNQLPNEACGLLGGRIEGNIKIIEKVYLLSNIDESPEHFSMNPEEQFMAIKNMRKNNLIMLGNFHSHPNSPSRPSEEDKRLAYDRNSIYMILSLEDRNKPILKSFLLKDNQVIEEEIIVCQGD